MIIDKKGKLFGKINLLDILIILVVLAFVALGAAKLFSGFTSSKNETTELIYTIEVTKKDADFFESIKEGDSVFKKNTKEPNGEVVSCEVAPAQYITKNLDSLTFEITEAENKFDGKIKIKVQADINQPDLMVDNEAIKIGKDYAVRTENSVLEGYIIDMEFDKELMGGLSNDN